jgi:hypothetical protein
MMNRNQFAFDEALEFLVSSHSDEEVLGFHVSTETKNRLHYLLARKQEGTLTAKENAELTAYADVALYVHMRKIQATRHMQ